MRWRENPFQNRGDATEGQREEKWLLVQGGKKRESRSEGKAAVRKKKEGVLLFAEQSNEDGKRKEGGKVLLLRSEKRKGRTDCTKRGGGNVTSTYEERVLEKTPEAGGRQKWERERGRCPNL